MGNVLLNNLDKSVGVDEEVHSSFYWALRQTNKNNPTKGHEDIGETQEVQTVISVRPQGCPPPQDLARRIPAQG